MTKVSVIIPSYNHEPYIADCLNSVINQTYQDFEIVITDDGSSDNTVRIIESFSDPRIKLYKHESNKGASVAANNSFRYSIGKYIAMISSDDIWLPEKLEEQVNYLDKNKKIGAVFSKVKWIDELSKPVGKEECPYYEIFNQENRTRFDWLRHFFYRQNVLCHPSSLIRRECLETIGYLNPLFASIPDLDLWVRLCLHYDIYVIDKALIKFRYFKDQSNASGSTLSGVLRNRYEYRKILDHYLTITDINDFIKIFPQANLETDKIQTNDLRFIIGKIAINTGVDFKILWGLDVLYAYFQNYGNAERAKKNFNFTYIDFINLTGHNDIPKLVNQEQRFEGVIENKENSIFEEVINRIKLRLSLRRKIKLIENSNLFDEQYYLDQNSDVKESRMSPIKHYIQFGGSEGRNPNKEFDSKWYLEKYSDVRSSGMNPLIHYIIFGHKEGRMINPESDSNN